MPLYFFYTTVQKSKMTKNSNQGGPALKLHKHVAVEQSTPYPLTFDLFSQFS